MIPADRIPLVCARKLDEISFQKKKTYDNSIAHAVCVHLVNVTDGFVIAIEDLKRYEMCVKNGWLSYNNKVCAVNGWR